MNFTVAQSASAAQALGFVTELQQHFARRLAAVAGDQTSLFKAVNWLRDHGRHGGGTRLGCADHACYQRASINVSQVHYDDLPEKRLGAATALSTIIHPRHPLLPSVHIHISWTEMKSGEGYWRMMADLNPAIVHEADRQRFRQALADACPDTSLFAHACAQGDAYFMIPVLQRHRGVMHFYLEQYRSDDTAADAELARRIGFAATNAYADIIRDRLPTLAAVTAQQQQAQLDYHTLYAFQVLTLDRGTTTGLMVHDQNDVGILGSLPARLNRALLASWLPRMPDPQQALLQAILDCLPDGHVVTIDDACKQRLAAALRQHYQDYPEALSMQASGDITPPTVANHQA